MFRILNGLARLGGLVSGLLIVFIMFAIIVNVVVRATTESSITWILEAVEYGLIGLTCTGSAWVLLEDKHTRVDVITASVSRTVAALLAKIADTIGLLTMAVMTWYSTQAVIKSYQSGAFIYEYIEIPEYYLFTGLPFCFGMMMLVFVQRLVSPRDESHTHHPKSAI